MNKEIYEARLKIWLDALRSDNYQQYQSCLHVKENGIDKFCCLGVACQFVPDQKKVTHSLTSDNLIRYEYNGRSGFINYAARIYYGLKSESGVFYTPYIHDDIVYTSLASINDSGKFNFRQIADIIESKKSELFDWAQDVQNSLRQLQ